jgi:hypothetical protein
MKEKIKNLLWRFDVCRDNEEETIDKLEDVADKFAIDFAEWLLNNDLYDEILLKISETKDLLELYKKNR